MYAITGIDPGGIQQFVGKGANHFYLTAIFDHTNPELNFARYSASLQWCKYMASPAAKVHNLTNVRIVLVELHCEDVWYTFKDINTGLGMITDTYEEEL